LQKETVVGQAKQRGTFEQRQTEGIAKRIEREQQAAKERMLREGLRNRRGKSQTGILLAAMMAMNLKDHP
jgi:hypothetical protein